MDGCNGRIRPMSDTTLRDQLAQIIYDTLNWQYGDFNMPDDAAEAILDAGWRPPARVVTTVEELDGLPVGSIVRDVERAALDEKWDDDTWAEAGYEYTFSSRSIHLPAAVIYDPEEGK